MMTEVNYSITSNRNFSNYYLAILARVLFFFILGFLVGILYKVPLSTSGELIMILMSLTLIYMGFYSVRRYYKNAPAIEVNGNSFILNNTIYYWKNLEEVRLTGKEHFNFFLMGDAKESTSLKFKDYDEIHFFDDMYENSASIKSFIHKQINLNSTVKIIEPQTVFSKAKKNTYEHNVVVSDESIQTGADEFRFYKGLSFLCLEGTFQWALIVLFICGVIAHIIYKGQGFIFGPLGLSLFFVSLFCKRMYYFGISNTEFIVKNQVLFWVKKVFQISDIREIVFEQNIKKPISLRLITNDFQSEVFFAASLWSVHWRGLQKEFEDKGIKVRVEVSIEPLNIVSDIVSDFRNIVKDVFPPRNR